MPLGRIVGCTPSGEVLVDDAGHVVVPPGVFAPKVVVQDLPQMPGWPGQAASSVQPPGFPAAAGGTPAPINMQALFDEIQKVNQNVDVKFASVFFTISATLQSVDIVNLCISLVPQWICQTAERANGCRPFTRGDLLHPSRATL